MEKNEILEYRRDKECWICPDCDTENDMMLGRCVVCGCGKNASVKVLKKWNEVKSAPKEIPPSTPPTPPIPPEKYSSDKRIKKLVVAIIIVLGIIGLILVGMYGGMYVAYAKAMGEFNEGNYQLAIQSFEKLPSNYKNVSYMRDEAVYQCACECLETGDISNAEDMFANIVHHSDTEEKLNECKYQKAYLLFQAGNYETAKSEFEEISYYSDSNEMMMECDYFIAIDYRSKGEYVKALKTFNDLGSFKDSKSQFNKTENALISFNQNNGYYYNEQSLLGEWSDSSGNYVAYKDNGGGTTNASYNLTWSDGKYYKIVNGIHYNGSDETGWKKQWIFQYVDVNAAQVYNYNNGENYNLSK